jgi:glycosyltransferase involved in cell wall biosynthesis
MLNHYAITPDLPGRTRHFDLATELADLGWDVTIFASAFSDRLRRKIRLLDGQPWGVEAYGEVRFVWVPSFPNQENDWRRIANMVDYTLRARWVARRLARLEPSFRPPDVVLGSAAHLFAGIAAYDVALHYGAHFVMEVRDLWPQSFIDMGMWQEGQLQVRFFRALEQYLYSRAERIVTLSPLTREYLASYSEEWAQKAVYIPNGTLVSRYDTVRAYRRASGSPIKAMYLGAMGPTNGLEVAVEALAIAQAEAPNLIQGIFVGNGPDRDRLQDMARAMGLTNIRFEAAVPNVDVPAVSAQADMFLAVQREVRYGSLTKLYDYMAVGQPIVSSLYVEHNNPLEEIGCGLAAEPGNARDLADKMLILAQLTDQERRAMGDRGLAYVREHNDYPVLARRLAEMLEDVLD